MTSAAAAAAAKQPLQFFLSVKERIKPKHDFEKHQTLGRAAVSSVGEEGFKGSNPFHTLKPRLITSPCIGGVLKSLITTYITECRLS